jgi:hypothetical protein
LLLRVAQHICIKSSQVEKVYPANIVSSKRRIYLLGKCTVCQIVTKYNKESTSLGGMLCCQCFHFLHRGIVLVKPTLQYKDIFYKLSILWSITNNTESSLTLFIRCDGGMSFPQNWSTNSPNLILSSINKSPTTFFVLFCAGLSQDVLIFEIEYSDSLIKAQFSKIANRNVHISAFQYLLKHIVNKCYCIGGCELIGYLPLE